MSTEWNVLCVDCSEQLGLSDASLDGVRKLIASARALVDIEGHALVGRNEYGAHDEDCGVYFACGCCGHSRACQLKRGHEGKHDVAPERVR